MNDKIKIELEYPLRVPKKIVFTSLSTVSGLNEWFAEKVQSSDEHHFTFTWEGESQEARLLEKKANQCIRFQWVDEPDKSVYFGFTLHTDELTRSTTLVVTDFVEASERDGAIDLWNKQISRMMHKFGTN